MELSREWSCTQAISKDCYLNKVYCLDRMIIQNMLEDGTGGALNVKRQIDALALVIRAISTSEGDNLMNDLLKFGFCKRCVGFGRPVHRFKSTINTSFLHHLFKQTYLMRGR